MKEQQEQQECENTIEEIITQVFHENESSFRPIESEQAVKSRREMMDEYYRGLSMTRPRQVNNNNNHNNRYYAERNDAIGYRRNENLDIPVGDFHVALPQ